METLAATQTRNIASLFERLGRERNMSSDEARRAFHAKISQEYRRALEAVEESARVGTR